eukprot:1542545-Prymnesium_polylepis.3
MKSSRVDSRKFSSHGKPSTFDRYIHAFAKVPESLWLHLHRYAASLRDIFTRIHDAFAKVLREIHTDSRRIRDGFATDSRRIRDGCTHSPSQFTHTAVFAGFATDIRHTHLKNQRPCPELTRGDPK